LVICLLIQRCQYHFGNSKERLNAIKNYEKKQKFKEELSNELPINGSEHKKVKYEK